MLGFYPGKDNCVFTNCFHNGFIYSYICGCIIRMLVILILLKYGMNFN